ncbi:hypothetical protein [Phytoactinopolyspora endophytica]|uniref:hypothetical protein n=1 Tax=Phytoactinopolyspora endophytica TaxID=1642495 RepID=UPI0013EA873D|nr:hypothetical protein [Phytoactinopolyspora endophytica]
MMNQDAGDEDVADHDQRRGGPVAKVSDVREVIDPHDQVDPDDDGDGPLIMAW